MTSSYGVSGSTAWCPGCRQDRRIAVLDTRVGDAVFPGRKRRRACLGCGHRWTTVEVPLELMLSLRELDRVIESMSASVQLMRAAFNNLGLPDDEG